MEGGGLPGWIDIAPPFVNALLYVVIGSVAWRWVFPRLTPSARVVAFGFFAAHIFIFVVMLLDLPTTKFDKWLWDVGKEWNIPSAIAGGQMALAGFVALAACLSQRQPAWQRLYFIAIGLVFLFLSMDEYFAFYKLQLEEFIWHYGYVGMGAAAALGTMLAAWRSPRRLWKWHAFMLAGLALVAFAGFVLDDYDYAISSVIHDDRAENMGMWMALVAVLGLYSDVSPKPSPRARGLLVASPILIVVGLCLWAVAVRPEMNLNKFAVTKWIQLLQTEFALRGGALRVEVKFEDGISLNAYSLDQAADSLAAQLLVKAKHTDDLYGAGYSLHLIDQASGESAAGADGMITLDEKRRLSMAQFSFNYIQRLRLDIPDGVPRNRAYWLALTVWRETGDGYERLAALESDLPRLGDSQVILDELVLPAQSTSSQDDPLATFENGFALLHVEAPDSATAGETLPITFTWRSDANGIRDYSQFLHLSYEATGEWFVYDQPPLGDRLPTRLWYKGMSDSETWHVPLHVDLAPGAYSVFTGLYRAEDKVRVSLTTVDGQSPPHSTLLVGRLFIDA